MVHLDIDDSLAAHQRTQQVFTAGNYVDYTYDAIGQLQTAVGRKANDAERLHEKFGYFYDAAWNLNRRTNHALVQTFDVNNLNQLTTLGRSGTLTVAGTTTSEATEVTVNELEAERYADRTFARAGFSLSDGLNTFTAIAEDAYGRRDTNVVSGPLAGTNLYRFSSKEWHAASGLVYYLYRSYDGSLQRWINRDPVQEKGGFNLYRYVRNAPTAWVDPTGLAQWEPTEPPHRPSLPPDFPQDWTPPDGAKPTLPSIEEVSSCAKRNCEAKGGVWQENWRNIGAEGVRDCARKIYDLAWEPIPIEIVVVIAPIGLYPPVGIGVGIGLPLQYVAAMDWCSAKGCSLD